MAHDHETRRKVRAAFVQGMPLTSAAEINHVRYATARKWKADDAKSGNDWDIARNARRMSSSGVEAFANQVMDGLDCSGPVKPNHPLQSVDKRALLAIFELFGRRLPE